MSGDAPFLPFVVERYAVARRIWKFAAEVAHHGFPATDRRAAVPQQTWAEWFEWAYGMTLEEYGKIAKAGNHAALAQKAGDGAVIAEYRIADRWYTVVGAPKETYAELCASMRRMFPQIEDVRVRQ